MELKKCARCGCFFGTAHDVCCNCETKDKQDIYNLNNYIDTSNEVNTLESLSFKTGVSIKNISRFIENDDISNI